MISLVENQIINFIKNDEIINRKILSNSFNMKCEKIELNNNKSYVLKYYEKENIGFNSIISEAKSLIYLYKIFPSIIPKISFFSHELLIIDFIKHNGIKHNDYQKILAREIIKIHSKTNKNYGFHFNSQIGAQEQPNKNSLNWKDFFKNQRIYPIYELINKSNKMPDRINAGLEKLIKNLENLIPSNPTPRLLHGDLWEGNILFNNGDLVGLIDPGIFFGHNEFELAYLSWFNYVDISFFNNYSERIPLEKSYFEYEPVYQIYYSLLNVYLWDRGYINDVYRLIKKLKLI
jgi:fructosamine-3-kinase